MTLHLLQQHDSLERARASIAPGDQLVLLAEACYLALSPMNLSEITVFVLSDDAQRRGIVPAAMIEPVDISGLVSLTEQHRHCLSW